MLSIPFEIQQQTIECFGRCFHYKDTVASFMTNCGVSNLLIDQWRDKPKFVWAKNVLDELNRSEEGRIIIRRIITEFYKMRDIPSEVENRNEGIIALRKLKELVIQNDFIVNHSKINNTYHQTRKDMEIKEIQNKSKVINELREGYFSQFTNSNTQKRGYELEKIITKLFKVNNISFQDSYRNKDNTQQIDGYFRFESFDYLVEVKWESSPINFASIASLKQKVDSKLNATRGLFIAVNGFREEVIIDYSNRDAKILFMNGEELAYILENRISLKDALIIKITEAAKIGNPNVSLRDRII